MAAYVVCPETITSPHPDPDSPVAELGPDCPCGLRVKVYRMAPLMYFRCGRGHEFIARPSDCVVGDK